MSSNFYIYMSVIQVNGDSTAESAPRTRARTASLFFCCLHIMSFNFNSGLMISQYIIHQFAIINVRKYVALFENMKIPKSRVSRLSIKALESSQRCSDASKPKILKLIKVDRFEKN